MVYFEILQVCIKDNVYTHHILAHLGISEYLIIAAYNDKCWYCHKTCKYDVKIRMRMLPVPQATKILLVVPYKKIGYL